MDLIGYINRLVEDFDRAELFYGHGTDNAFDEAVYLAYGVLNIEHQKNIETVNRDLSIREIDLLNEQAHLRIKKRIPIAYLLNEAWFAGYKFYSDERALVPRSPIAELILNRFEPLLRDEPQNILDLCCGGGCIGIACAKKFPLATVDLVDIDSLALELAESNIALQNCTSRVNTIQSNLFRDIEGSYDLIICNPPYVSQKEFENLPQEFKAEPMSGLIGGEDGIEIPVNVLKEAEKYLTPKGLLIMELGFSADLLEQKYENIPFLWLEFFSGGEGVLALTREQLKKYSREFN